LHNHLLDLVQQGNQLGEMVVMAPDIMEYYPYIQMVFDETPLKYQVNDLSSAYQSSLIQIFVFLLRLSMSRWDAYTVWQLFEDARFQKKQQLNFEDLALIKHWLEESRILWGENGAHRGEILQRNFCHAEIGDGQTIGTWEWAFGRLIEGLAMDEALPIVEATDMILLGRWISLMRSLRHDLRVCTDNTRMTLKNWVDYLQKLLEKYFALDSLTEADEALFQQFKYLSSLPIEESLFPFSSVFHHLENNLAHHATPYRERELNVVRFSSLKAIPADVVALLGMQEGSFPRIEKKSPLNLLSKATPGQTDFDRYLFLEILLSAKKRLLISYQGINGKDNEKQAPSILVTELMNYCDQAFTINGIKWSDNYPCEHPFSPFDSRYFTNEKKWISHSQEHYLQAVAHYQKKSPPFHFIPTFSSKKPLKEPFYEITISQLKAFAKNPMRAYFNQTLGMFIKEDKRKLYAEEPFDLTPLEKYQLKQEAFSHSIEHAFIKAEKEGRLPFGAFKSLAYNNLNESIQELQATYHTLGIGELFTIELSQKTANAAKEGLNWKVPPLKVFCPSGAEVILTGLLTDVCSDGLVLNFKDDRTDAVKVYPLLLILSCLVKAHALPVKPHLLFVKSGQRRVPFFQEGEKLLAEYLEYYLEALQNISPLIPEFTSDIMRKEPLELTRTLSQKLANTHQPVYNEELAWMYRGKDFYADDFWKSRAEKLYSELFQSWYD
jgi:exodeoxyribonuclease V gamma subunit